MANLLDEIIKRGHNDIIVKKVKAVGKNGAYSKFLKPRSNDYGEPVTMASMDELKRLKNIGLLTNGNGKWFATPEAIRAIDELGPVNVDDKGNVVRYHATDSFGFNGIVNDGFIRTRQSEKPRRDKYGNYIKDYWNFEPYTRPVFTSTESWADEYKRPIAMRMRIPQDEYRMMKRQVFNPDHHPYDYREHVLSVDRGGTSDFIEENLPIRYIDEVCLDPDRKECYDVSEIPIFDVQRKLNER